MTEHQKKEEIQKFPIFLKFLKLSNAFKNWKFGKLPYN